MNSCRTQSQNFRRLCLAAVLLLAALWPAAAEVDPQRLLLLRGVIALADKHPDAALGDLQGATEMAPEDWRSQALYGQALQLDGQLLLAKAQFRRATLLAPNTAEAWQMTARFARDTANPHLELAALAGQARLFPEDPPLLRRMAAVYRALGRVADADKLDAAVRNSMPPLQLDYRYEIRFRPATLAELQQLAKDDPTNTAVLSAQATAQWAANDRAAACDTMRRLCALTPTSIEAISNYAHACLATGQTEEALRVLTSAAPLGNYALDRALSLWCLSLGRYQQAVEPLERLLMRNPIDVALNRQLGMAMLASGDAEAACAGLRIAWLRGHDHLTAQAYATALLAAGHPQDAETLLKQAMTLMPNETALGLQLSLLYRDTGRLVEAAELTTGLAKIRPETVELLTLAGERFHRAGFLQRTYSVACQLRDDYPADLVAAHGAVQLFRKLSILPEARLTLTRYLGPSFPSPLPSQEILMLVSRYAAEDNRMAEAIIALDEIITYRPQYRPAYAQLARLYMQRENWADAKRVLNQALAQWPRDPECTLALARTTWQEGNYPLALAVYQRATGLLPTADPWLEMGTVYHAQGDEGRARECWQTAQTKLDGTFRARLSLYNSFRRTGELDRAAELLNGLAQDVRAERDRRTAAWRRQLADRGFTATPDELNALLQLEPDLVDPPPAVSDR